MTIVMIVMKMKLKLRLKLKMSPAPQPVDDADMQAKLAEMGCVDISLDASPELASRASTTTSTMTVGSTHPREARQSTPGEVSSGGFGQ